LAGLRQGAGLFFFLARLKPEHAILQGSLPHLSYGPQPRVWWNKEPVKKPCEEKTILLIDQSDHDVELFEEAAYHSCNARVHRVRSGREAIDYLIHRQPVEGGLPSLIIVEWDLPSSDGFSLLRFVNGTHALKPIPTIVLTGAYSEERIESARDLGAESVFLKPTDIDEMDKLVYALCEVYIHFALPPPQTHKEPAPIQI
jgi:CheY-like chemotaxis protein